MSEVLARLSEIAVLLRELIAQLERDRAEREAPNDTGKIDLVLTHRFPHQNGE